MGSTAKSGALAAVAFAFALVVGCAGDVVSAAFFLASPTPELEAAVLSAIELMTFGDVSLDLIFPQLFATRSLVRLITR